MTDVKAVSAGFYYTMVIKNDGSLWAFGENDGKFGMSTMNESYNIPLMVQ